MIGNARVVSSCIHIFLDKMATWPRTFFCLERLVRHERKGSANQRTDGSVAASRSATSEQGSGASRIPFAARCHHRTVLPHGGRKEPAHLRLGTSNSTAAAHRPWIAARTHQSGSAVTVFGGRIATV